MIYSVGNVQFRRKSRHDTEGEGVPALGIIWFSTGRGYDHSSQSSLVDVCIEKVLPLLSWDHFFHEISLQRDRVGSCQQAIKSLQNSWIRMKCPANTSSFSASRATVIIPVYKIYVYIHSKCATYVFHLTSVSSHM